MIKIPIRKKMLNRKASVLVNRILGGDVSIEIETVKVKKRYFCAH